MSDELSEYEQQRLAIEEEKLEALREIKKELRHQGRMKQLQQLIERLDIDREDVESLIGLIGGKIAGENDNEDEGGGLKGSIEDAVRTAAGGDVDVEVEFEGDDDAED